MRGRRTRKSPKRISRRLRIFMMYVKMALLLLVAFVIVVVAGAFYSLNKNLPTGLDISQYSPTEATKVFSADGVILADVYEENREIVPITDIPDDLRRATVAIEDSRFYNHIGVDPRGIARAVVENLRRGRMSQGGSTLTQQLARNVYLSREKSISRKLQEVILALKIERNYSKEQILELYLNQVYYGSGAYGVQTASRIYFGKDVKDLNLAECALLAGLPQKPSGYNPHEYLDDAVARRNVVLARMVQLGYITGDQADSAKAENVKLIERKPKGISHYKAPWFVAYVIREVTKALGPDAIYRDGLRIQTTLNFEMQEIAEKALREGVARTKRGNASQGALISINPHNGYIVAMVGGVNPDFTKDQFNRAVQAKRQPGSAFKAFVYTAAIDNGFDPHYRVSNARITFSNPGSKPWTPRNYDGRYGGTYSLTQAVAQSINIVAVRVAQKVGIDEVIRYARLCGIESPLSPNLSLALGSAEVSPLELTSAYGVFATRGIRAEPMSIVKITDRDGGIIMDNAPQTAQVLSQETADVVSEMFRAVVTSGTGRRVRYSVPNAHGKTGTTNDDRDAWFVGYTPELVTGVWIGNDNNAPMRNIWGSTGCLPIWEEFMRRAVVIRRREDASKEEKAKPETVRETKERPERRRERQESPPPEPTQQVRQISICAESGLEANPHCPNTYKVELNNSNASLGKCQIHRGAPEADRSAPEPLPRAEQPAPPRPPAGDAYVTLQICADTGRVATIYCPERVTKRFRPDEAPSRVCTVHVPKD